MAMKELPEGGLKKSRSVDINRSLKDLIASLKSNFDEFLKIINQGFSLNEKCKHQFSAITSNLDVIKSSLDNMRFPQRLKSLRENPTLLSDIIIFVDSICQLWQKVLNLPTTKDEAAIMLGYSLGLLSTIGKLLSKRIVGEGYIFEPTVKILNKLGAIGHFLAVLDIYCKAIELYKSNLYSPMDKKLKEVTTNLFPIYAMLLNILLQGANEDTVLEFDTKYSGCAKLIEFLKHSYNHKQFEAYKQLVSLIPIISISMKAEVSNGLFVVLKEHLFELTIDKDEKDLHLSLLVSLRSLIMVNENCTGIDKLKNKIEKAYESEWKNEDKSVLYCLSYLLFEIWNSTQPKEDEKTTGWKQELQSEYTNYQNLKEQLKLLKIKHYDCPKVVSSLKRIQKLISEVIVILIFSLSYHSQALCFLMDI